MSGPGAGRDSGPGSGSPTLPGTLGPDTGTTGAHETVTELQPGQRVGRYVVGARLGAGGMGVVYAAHDGELDRPIALKVVRGGGGPARLLRAQKRLQREAQAMAALSHPNVVTVHDVLLDHDRLCVAMELVDGGSLREWCKTSHTTDDIVRVFIEAGRGLAAAHHAGLVHRDFKPDNVLMDPRGRVLVSDFGLARGEARSGATQSADSDERTIGGVGTPAYMAPEQFARATIGPAADQFAFCVALHEALHGSRPFAGTTAHEIAAAVTRGERIPAPRSAVPARLRRAIDRGLRLDPAERWPTMDALVHELRRAIDRRPRWPWLVGATAAAGVGVWLSLPTAPSACAETTTARIAAAWNDTVRAQLQAAYTERATRPEDWADVAAAVDTWVAAWHDTQQQLCGHDSDGAHVDPDAGLQCLRERAAALERTVESLDPATVPSSRAPALVHGMARPETCADPTVLVASPLPDDPALRALARSVGEATASVRTLADVGRYADAAALGTAMERAAEPLGDAAPVLALRQELANVLLASGKPEEARALLEGIYWAAEGQGHDALAADASSLLLHVAAGVQNPETERWVSFARAASDRASPAQPLARARFLGGLGAVRFSQGQLAEASEAFAEQVARLEELDGSPMAIITAKQNLAAMLIASGRIDEGEVLCRAVIAAFDSHLGAHHPELANPLLNLSNLLADERQDYPAAIAAATRAHAILVESHGPGAPPTIYAQLTLGEAQADGAFCDDAIATMRDVLARIRSETDDWNSTVTARTAIARCLHEGSRRKEAVQELLLAERAIPSETDDLRSLLRARGKLANAQSAVGELEGALASFEAVRQLSLTIPGGQLLLGYAAELGELRLRQGHFLHAARDLEESMPYLDTFALPIERGLHRLMLGEALWQIGHDRVRAVAIVREARTIAGLTDADLAFFDLWLAAHPDPSD